MCIRDSARECACTARMRAPPPSRTIDCESSPVTAHHSKRMRENLLEIFLTHRVSEHPDISPAPYQQSGCGIERIAPPGLCIAAKALSFCVTILGCSYTGDLDIVPPSD